MLALLISCEHAVNYIPKAYESLFKEYHHLLNAHQGIDFGASEVALYLQKKFSCPLIQASTSRLLIDCNRSLHNRCFSPITQKLSLSEKQEIIEKYYTPYRDQVQTQIEDYLAQGMQVLHCSIHSFTPIMDNRIRTTDIAFLYNPQRLMEKQFAKEWKVTIKEQNSMYRLRMNYPYKGISDGLTTAMRKKYSETEYLGLEIELNQELTQNQNSFIQLKKDLAASLARLI